MRTAFIKTLCELAEQDERIWLLCGDLGYSVLEGFSGRFPDRFVNVGVAEQNMTGIAAGLALSGKVVFIYSIANFPVMRCLEQIRNDVCYHNLNVKIVTVGGGLTYGSLGYTHHGVEDIAVMRVLPNMTVIAPGDPVEARLATQAILNTPGPCYLRLGKAGEPVVHQIEPEFQIGKAISLQLGIDLTLISTGGMLQSVVLAAEKLASQGYSVQVLSMPTVYPLDESAIVQASKKTGKILTVEEHGLGGLGSAVAEVLALGEIPVKFKSLRLQREAIKVAGSQAVLRASQGLSLEEIVEVAISL
ncbi:MAG: transketolase [Microcoleus sp. PH2017_07_MST_O_A]|uniref:transketolase family protein n=1 Tax=unclassified Microcoleus TaxID=2642155 RepID=UPI001DD359F2|nr:MULTISPECIES: transketolase C-terminal domain-containing protein [unclassified Microcoleus]MCC3419287.1 transketolase [Microcoleus sp. PH2017_07_MST_O_A]MCC3510850.1 transketolase [Microcoleus sp. PH2017_17_BER_D_A]TAE68954.1 MAG: transketolase [Oscillatoriales cyanobacterium]MCC3448053.1 transketolase [Microcoleus sp. PH2017_09_SFU_O_A]MCC3628969.1 transketolase [Microcoleus sp. PH2017_39_LGB_O_B]